MGPGHGLLAFSFPCTASLRSTALLGGGFLIGHHCTVVSSLCVSLCTAATPTRLEDQRPTTEQFLLALAVHWDFKVAYILADLQTVASHLTHLLHHLPFNLPMLLRKSSGRHDPSLKPLCLTVPAVPLQFHSHALGLNRCVHLLSKDKPHRVEKVLVSPSWRHPGSWITPSGLPLVVSEYRCTPFPPSWELKGLNPFPQHCTSPEEDLSQASPGVCGMVVSDSTCYLIWHPSVSPAVLTGPNHRGSLILERGDWHLLTSALALFQNKLIKLTWLSVTNYLIL